VMVFVNDISGVKGLPWWTYHMPENANGMTYVDMVFPTFLFLVGMSIPLAINHRRARGESFSRILAHVLTRSIGLVVMGLFLANLHNVDPQQTGISRRLWALLMFAGVILVWNRYPRSSKLRPFYRVLKWSGLLLLAWLVFIFRRRTGQVSSASLDFSYPEILGLIGCAYLSVSILYLLLKKSFWVFVACLAALNVLNIVAHMGLLRWLENIPIYFWPLETGASASITMAGLAASFIFFEKTVAASFKAKAGWAMGYAAVLFGAGWALTPLGISKDRGTPTWCLYSAAACVVIFLLLYWLAEVRQLTSWAAFVHPAGSNTLTTYLLPWICYSIPFVRLISASGSAGWVGVVRALVFTAFILALSALAIRLRISLQL
jgi:heparan-alpha-glucosaminide N-acetyltransferase